MPGKETAKKDHYTLLSIFGLGLKTRNKHLADIFTKRIIDAYEVFLILAIISLITAFCLNITDSTIFGYNSVSFEKLTIFSLLFAITFALALFMGKRD